MLSQIAPNWLRGNSKHLFHLFVSKEEFDNPYLEPMFNLAEFLLLLALFSKATLKDKFKYMFNILLLFENKNETQKLSGRKLKDFVKFLYEKHLLYLTGA